MVNRVVAVVSQMINSQLRKIRLSVTLAGTCLFLASLCLAQERLNASSAQEKIISGGYMQTSFTLSRSGQVTADTRSWTNNSFQGFHGTARIIICNSDGDCFISPEQGCGVAGKLDPSGPSNRHCYWQFNVPSDIAARANRYTISHGKNEVPIWNNPDVRRCFDQAGRLIRENKEDAKKILDPFLKALN